MTTELVTTSAITTLATAATTVTTTVTTALSRFPIFRTSTIEPFTSAMVEPLFPVIPSFEVECYKIIDPDICSSFGCSYCYKIFWFQCSETCSFEPWMWWTAFLFPLMFCLLPLCVIFCCLSSKAEAEKRNQVAMERAHLRNAMMASRPAPQQQAPQVYNQYVVPPYDPYTAGQVYPAHANRDVGQAAAPYTQVAPEQVSPAEAAAIATATAASAAEAERVRVKKEAKEAKEAIILPPLEEREGVVANTVAKIDRKILIDTGDFVEDAAAQPAATSSD